jgi:translation initiation factor 1
MIVGDVAQSAQATNSGIYLWFSVDDVPKDAHVTKKDPFAALEQLRDQLPKGPATPTPAPVAAPKPPARAVVRMERKGRRGKEVTVVEKLALKPAELEQWCKELKQALGCGGAVETDAIVLQGDLRDRVAAVLEKKGVAKVTLG